MEENELSPAPITHTASTLAARPRLLRRWAGAVDAFTTSLIRRSWVGVALGAAAAMVVGQGFLGTLGRTGLGTWVDVLVMVGASALAAAVLGATGLLALWLVKKLPKALVFTLVGVFGALAALPFAIWPVFVVIGALAGGLAGCAVSRGMRMRCSLVLLAAAVACVAVPFWWCTDAGSDSHLVTQNAASGAVAKLDLPDPSASGALAVKHLTYGSGKDRHRPEYGAGVTIATESVDASAFLPSIGEEWRAFARTTFWGFDSKQLPLNARVWYPDDAGPFPLVLIVHGNHQMEDFSDPGYAYLGEHLASRGYILASIDENFLNGNRAGDYGQRESVTRTWLLFQHLALWKKWNGEYGHVFAGKVDLANIALIGHSRGGQAVVTAAGFNRLSASPDEATRPFEFNYGIKSIVAIAPNDPYEPCGAPAPLKDVNFMTLSGGHDSDASSFWGLRQYYRAQFGGEAYRCKCAVYLYRGNHGQFNSVWGRYDFLPPNSWVINAKPLMPGEDQRKAAKAFISAFLDATLKGKTEYIAFLRDHRRGLAWLPEDLYVTQFEDSDFCPVVDFSEDIEVRTTTVCGGSIGFERLSHVTEHLLSTRDGAPTRQKVIYLGWDRGSDKNAPPPYYAIALPAELAADWRLDARRRLTFLACNSKSEPLELDLSVEVVDAAGQRASLKLSSIAPLHPPLIARISKSTHLATFNISRDWEQMLQTYEIPLGAFLAGGSTFDPARLTAIRFVFDQTSSGEIVLARIGFAKAP